MKILLIHGVGHVERPATQSWNSFWEEAMTAGLQYFNPSLKPVYDHLDYDDLFTGHFNLLLDLAAAARLGFAPIGAALSDVADRVSGWFRPRRGLFDWTKPIAEAADGWHAGMVAEWDQKSDLRRQLRSRLIAKINAFEPDIIAAHSLGSIICYDTFTSREGSGSCNGRYFITFGSQIGNSFLKAAHFGNRIHDVGQKYWFHLYNKSDPVLTHRILDHVPNFEEISWDDDVAGHEAVTDLTAIPDHAGYLQRDLTWDHVYRILATRPTPRTLAVRGERFRKTIQARNRRALLIGINNYPDPAARLDGCVNDVFLMSSVLQEMGFDPSNIRIVLDERATRAAIRERIDWLLDGTADGQERILFYSGHGAQLPQYNAAEVTDHVDECLVPYDFHWTRESAITDDDFLAYYTALPYSAKFYAIFDCCHSGGLARDGARKIRAVIPPDDIRHRMLRWNRHEQMWEERQLDSLNRNFGGDHELRKKFMGNKGHTKKLGSGMSLREDRTAAQYDKAPKARPGPFMPVILEACEEGAYAYEYHHGAISYGVFTYALAKEFRKAIRKRVSFNVLRDRVNATMKTLHYDQICAVEGPESVCSTQILRR
ncbi:MAG TPA: caspase family protein [Chthoniobacterales bacterium]|nr:caspase family protein [Chthoniobacterales bacterium]